ncbi:MAG TPA: chloride channel protein [Spongiibacteraceae bacterium]
MAIVWLTRHFANGASGSGIPQVIAALRTDLPVEGKQHLVSLPLSFSKLLLCTLGMLSGFSIGREGPSVQIAAGVLRSFHRFIGHKVAIHEHDIILAGGAAGIAAAFNTPLAGIVFAFEELSKRFEERSSGVLITAIVIAGLVAVSTMGNLNYFGRVEQAAVWSELFWPGIIVALATGSAGGLFSYLLIHSFRNMDWPINRWRHQHPLQFAGLCGLIVAVLGLLSGGAAFGSGYKASQQLLANQHDISVFYFIVKFLSTWISFWSGIPGGIFAPALSVGAGMGYDVALLTSSTGSVSAIVALGMAGFLAAITQAPITSFIIVMEMTDGHSMVLSLMATALVASMLSRIISEPLYPALADLQIDRVQTLLGPRAHLADRN